MSEWSPPRPALTADSVVFAGPAASRRVLLIRRGRPPFEGMWALPGGFLDEYELPEAAARRELAEETGLEIGELPVRLVGVYGERGRDPRGWTVSAVFMADLGETLPEVTGGDDAERAEWHPVDDLPELAFDHARILGHALVLLGE